MRHRLGALALSLLLATLAACAGESGSRTSGMDILSPTPVTTVPPASGPLPVATPALVPGQTPGSQEETWVQDRVRAVVSLYNISPAGREWLESYDLRQMVGRPGWFGSLGFELWAGVGQAKPDSVLHEISHSYYGAFPVSGRPELSWSTPPGEAVSPAMEKYQEDLITFMFQPPDSFEPLRERFRNLPNLSREEDPDLFHFGEADLLYTTGGSLDLIPPILRKYFDQFLISGGVQTWQEAIAWYLGLSPAEQKDAESYIGLPHLPLKGYRALDPSEPTHLPEEVNSILETEERQRLTDFAQQFDLILGNELSFVDAADVDRSFQFWRGYLRDMLRLHEKHPQVLANAGAKGPELKRALDMFLEAKKMSESQHPDFFKNQLKDPFLVNFSVLLPSRVLIELFGRSPDELPLESVGGVVGRFSQKLAGYAKEVDHVVSTGRTDLQSGSDKLEKFLGNLDDDEQKKDLSLIFDLMKDTDKVTTKTLVNRLSDGLILRMLKNKASAVRSDNVSPERLLYSLKITSQNSPSEIVEGVKVLLKETSGNFQIDEPFTSLAYRVISDLGTEDFQVGLEMLRDSQVPLLDYIRASPEASVKILSSDLADAARLIANPQGYARSPQGIVHGLIQVDPTLAGRIIAEMERQGREDIVIESLIVFAYDSTRLRAIPGLPISLEQDGRFLKGLLEDKGADWLESRMREAVKLYEQHVERNEVPGDFLAAYEGTLKEVASKLDDRKAARTLEGIIGRVFA